MSTRSDTNIPLTLKYAVFGVKQGDRSLVFMLMENKLLYIALSLQSKTTYLLSLDYNDL